MNGNDARSIANRENAKKSTGPRTAEGKARSRANAFKHGLAGDGVAFPGEVAGEMQRFVDRQVAAEPIPPRDDREQMLVERIARISWLVDRAERAEEAQAVVRAADAERALRRKRHGEVAELVALLDTEHAWAMQEMLESKAGCRWAIDSIRELIDAVDADWWLCGLDPRLDALCSPAQPGRLRISRAKAIALALGSGRHEAVWPDGIPGLDALGSDPSPEALRAWNARREEILREFRPKWRAELKSILERRLAEVLRRLAELEARPDPAMEFAAIAATFDLGEQTERLRRFIRSRERERRHLIAELAEHRRLRDENPIEAEPSAIVNPEPAPSPPPPLIPMEQPPDAVLNREGYGLNSPPLADRWVRSGEIEYPRDEVEFKVEEPERKPRR